MMTIPVVSSAKAIHWTAERRRPSIRTDAMAVVITPSSAR